MSDFTWQHQKYARPDIYIVIYVSTSVQKYEDLAVQLLKIRKLSTFASCNLFLVIQTACKKPSRPVFESTVENCYEKQVRTNIGLLIHIVYLFDLHMVIFDNHIYGQYTSLNIKFCVNRTLHMPKTQHRNIPTLRIWAVPDPVIQSR